MLPDRCEDRTNQTRNDCGPDCPGPLRVSGGLNAKFSRTAALAGIADGPERDFGSVMAGRLLLPDAGFYRVKNSDFHKNANG